jgi:hypothetical protein
MSDTVIAALALAYFSVGLRDRAFQLIDLYRGVPLDARPSPPPPLPSPSSPPLAAQSAEAAAAAAAAAPRALHRRLALGKFASAQGYASIRGVARASGSSRIHAAGGLGLVSAVRVNPVYRTARLFRTAFHSGQHFIQDSTEEAGAA